VKREIHKKFKMENPKERPRRVESSIQNANKKNRQHDHLRTTTSKRQGKKKKEKSGKAHGQKKGGTGGLSTSVTGGVRKKGVGGKRARLTGWVYQQDVRGQQNQWTVIEKLKKGKSRTCATRARKKKSKAN